MRFFARLAVLVLLTPLLRGQKTPAPTPAPAPVANSSIHGVVRDEITHRPLAGVRIQLVWIVPHSKIPKGTSTASLANGTYKFEHLAQHPYYLVADQPHYLRQTTFTNYLGEGELTLTPGADREADLTLTPEAAIEGIILDARGAPVEGISVAAIRERPTHGLTTYDFTDDGEHLTGLPDLTDARGHYRIGRLPAGTYAALALVDPIQTPAPPSATAALENGSLPVYLGGAFSLQHASRITLTPGATYKANFKLVPHTRHMIRGTIRFAHPPAADFDQPLASLDEPFNGPRNFQPWQITYDKKNGTFQLGPLVPGEYDLTMATGVYVDKDLFARKAVTVANADVDHVDLTLIPRFSLNVKITTSRILPRGEKAALLRLQRDGEPFIEAGTPIDRSGALAFLNLEPGHYTLHLLSQEPFTIESARFAGQDVLAHGLTLKGPSDSFLEVTLGYTPTR